VNSTDIKKIVKTLEFKPKEGASGVFSKIYTCGYAIEVDFEKEDINYGDKIQFENKTIQNFLLPENFVVLECVNRLLKKGYRPENITLEKTYPAGHGTSGRLDICVTRDDGSEYLLIECKTYGKEFEKAFTRMKRDGGQLFTYFKFSNKPDVIMLYASELKDKEVVYRNEIIKIEDSYRTGDVKDFYEKWNKLTKDNGVFDAWVKPYNFESKALTVNDLTDITQEDSSFIFNRFLEILRHNVVSDKPNAFNKIFTLFLCKIYDEKANEETSNQLDFQWIEGVDDDVSFQLRLTDLYKKGMYEFLEKRVTDFSEDDFDKKYKQILSCNKELSSELKQEINRIRLEKNNEFAIKEVYDKKSFTENGKVVKEIVELLQRYKIRYTKKQQYLSDFFELLLTTGLKQESGQFFTPVPVAQFIIRSLPIDTFIKEKLQTAQKNEMLPYIIDYAAGSGHFVTESMHELQSLLNKYNAGDFSGEAKRFIKKAQDYPYEWAFNYIYGIEKDYRLVKVGKVGCYLHGDGLANVIHSDGLASFSYPEYKCLLKEQNQDFEKENNQFDIVVSNPPYSVSAFKNAAREYYSDNDYELYDSLTDNSSEIECLFVERTKQLLKDGGVSGVVLPSSILSNEGIYTKAREIILKYFEIVAITELGSNTFMATGTNTVVLFMRRRNNYDVQNFAASIENSLNSYQDNTINGIEKPIAKYINYVWENINFDDYVTILKKEPNSAVANHEIYKEYRKKIKAKTEKDFWNTVIETEKEKLLYFILAYPQKVILVKTGEKDAEKRFLGYEFSNRRGSEGIHPIQRGKSISECTKLFDEEKFDNPEKASTYIYKAFNGDYDFVIDESLKDNVFRVDLVDMLTFDRATFGKNISTAVKKKVKFDTKWEEKRLDELVAFQSGLWKGEKGELQKIKVLRNTNFKLNNGHLSYDDIAEIDVETKQLECRKLEYGDIILEKSGGSDTQAIGRIVIFSKKDKEIYSFSNFCSRIRVLDKKAINPIYLWTVLNDFYKKGGTIPLQNGVRLLNIDFDGYKSIKIPLPPKEIQEKIVAEIEVLEKKEAIAVEKIEKLKNSISIIIDKTTGVKTKLRDITTKIGSGATPLGGKGVYKNAGITFIRSQNVYDSCFVEDGLAYIDEEQAKKLDNVTVEKDDILFNITGASIARCCIIDEKYLPARVNQHVSIIRVNEYALSQYVQLILTSKEHKNELLQIGDGATSRQAITKEQLENFTIPVPPLSEQQKIVTKIENIEAQIAEAQKIIDGMSVVKNEVLKRYL
jgi:type I restriction enzyme M protein